MSNSRTLYSLPNGSFAVVTEINAEDANRKRLLELGLIPGTKVEVVRRSPAGNLIAFNIRGAVIALRKEVSGKVLVR